MIMVRIRGDFYNTESYARNKIESLIQEKKRNAKLILYKVNDVVQEYIKKICVLIIIY